MFPSCHVRWMTRDLLLALEAGGGAGLEVAFQHVPLHELGPTGSATEHRRPVGPTEGAFDGTLLWPGKVIDGFCPHTMKPDKVTAGRYLWRHGGPAVRTLVFQWFLAAQQNNDDLDGVFFDRLQALLETPPDRSLWELLAPVFASWATEKKAGEFPLETWAEAAVQAAGSPERFWAWVAWVGEHLWPQTRPAQKQWLRCVEQALLGSPASETRDNRLIFRTAHRSGHAWSWAAALVDAAAIRPLQAWANASPTNPKTRASLAMRGALAWRWANNDLVRHTKATGGCGDPSPRSHSWAATANERARMQWLVELGHGPDIPAAERARIHLAWLPGYRCLSPAAQRRMAASLPPPDPAELAAWVTAGKPSAFVALLRLKRAGSPDPEGFQRALGQVFRRAVAPSDLNTDYIVALAHRGWITGATLDALTPRLRVGWANGRRDSRCKRESASYNASEAGLQRWWRHELSAAVLRGAQPERDSLRVKTKARL